MGLGQGVEAAAGQQLGSEGLVEAFDLAGGGRAADAGEPVGDPLFAADAVEQHLGRVGAEPAGEHLAVIGQQLLRAAVAVQGGGEDAAHAAGVGPLDQPGHDAESGVVVDSGYRLEFAAVDEPDPTHDVQLPQLHRPGSLPAPVVGLASPPGLGLDQAVAHQGPVDAGQPRWWVDSDPDQFVGEAALAPVGMVSAQLAQVGFDLGRHLMWAAQRPMRAVGQSVQPAGPIAAQPAVDRLAAHPVAVGDLEHREPVAQHLHDGVEALLCHCELPEHAPDLLASPLVGEAQEARAVVSTINRNSGTHQPVSIRQASTGRAQPDHAGPGQKFARNCATRSLTPPHYPTLNSASHPHGCVDARCCTEL
ncbi:MAG TPA: hypothetical protein VFU54_05720 [Actinomycetota bacterium]|nr:hypothetical protein [Actinomycetota bacterium]